jgi:hypothetical protein
MNMKKSLPVIFLVVLAIIALALKRCNQTPSPRSDTSVRNERTAPANKQQENDRNVAFDRTTTNLYFTKHARCRMKCRQITQREVKDILANGKVNYSKSDLNDPQGPTYAVEGNTDDRQHVRIIFAPKQKHLSVVTVIDLDVEHQCDCN